MRLFNLDLRVGNLKTAKVGKVASELFKANSGDFSGYLVLTDSYGYEVWQDSETIALPAVRVAGETTVSV
jgi:hypothetical protein